ncbi:MAG: S-layer homology domain-containing protein [bacterium]
MKIIRSTPHTEVWGILKKANYTPYFSMGLQILSVLFILLVLSPIVFAIPVAKDPTQFVPNARVIGLGKAYYGLADDVASMYTNPAGMADVAGWQMSSLSGKFLDEFSYTAFSGLYPTEYGVFGLAFSGTSVGGAYPTTIEAGSDPADPIYTIDTSQPIMGNYNNAFVLSYANSLKKFDLFKKIPMMDRVSFGLNYKIFQVALYGDGIVGGEASGSELDLGLKVYPRKWLNLGLAFKNILPFTAGGKLKYASGHEETYPAAMTIGAALNLWGKTDSLYEMGEHNLKLVADMNSQLSLKNNPNLFHIGAEWKPIPMLALRAGIDQDTAGDGQGGLTVISDMAYGVGFLMNGFVFDYAYRTFSGAGNMGNQFFSLSYSQPVTILDLDKGPIILTSPPDKLITFESKVVVAGRVVEPRVRTLLINGILTRYSLRGEIATTEVSMRIGKNKIIIEGKDEDQVKVFEKRNYILRLVRYPDVPVGYWVEQQISLLAMAGIITGYPDSTFRPNGNITRAEMCSLLMKTLALPATSEAPLNFKDVNPKHWAAKFIAQAAQRGVVKGYEGNIFKPSGNITRAEGLAMIARFAGIGEIMWERQFPDLTSAHWVAKTLSGASKAGIVDYLKGKDFEPNKQLTRAETVEMLYRTKAVQEILKKDLLNWESY